MAKKLKTYVHAVGRDDQGNVTNAGVFGPDDQVPDWAANSITNPDVWDDDSDDTDAGPSAANSDSLPVTPETDTSTSGRPPTSGSGSGRDAWAAYAASQGVEVTADMDRAAIIAAVDDKQK